MFNTKQPYVLTNHHLSYQNPPVFFTKHYISKQATFIHVVFFQIIISKILMCFFHKTLHFISKHLNPSNYKPCLYNLFVYLYTKNTKDRPVFFHKNTTFQKSSCVLTKHLNPSNYKPCLYICVKLCFFHKTLHFKIYKTLKSE